MTETVECGVCNDMGHSESELIWVGDKAFCPVTHRRAMTDEEAEDMTDEEFDEALKECLKLVQKGNRDKWNIVKEAV